MIYDEKIKKYYDVGIVGWWYYYNYGSILTYLGLCKALESKGYSVLMIRKITDGIRDLENKLPENAINRYCTISNFYSEEDSYKLNDICNTFITGSDQMWNPLCEPDAGKQYFLNFADEHHKKISYASSLGNAKDASVEFKKEYQSYVSRFDAVSVREKYSIEACKNIYGVEPEQVCDPVFLCEKDFYYELSAKSSMKLEEDYLLCFILDPSDEKIEIIKRVADEKGLKVKCLVDLTDANVKAERLNQFECYPYADVEDFLCLFKNANFIITDSFHGTCFSIIFEREFISIPNVDRGNKRVKELLSIYGIEDRIVNSIEELTIYDKIIDYAEINKRIEKEKERSFKWLLSKLGVNEDPLKEEISNLRKNEDFIRIRLMVTLLRDYGIRKVVLSPGGRDVPIVRMIEYNEECFDIYRVTDERSAAYFAMGMARQLNEPVACICTSGTAVSNYMPAVTEAYYTGVPVVYITADRQQIYLGMGEDQTIPQANIFKDVTKKEVTLPEGRGYKVERQIVRDVSDCILETTHNGLGPVHINISIDDITIGSRLPKRAWELYPYIYPHLLRVKYEEQGDLIRWVEDARQSKRIMIVYGQNQILSNKERGIIEEFIRKYNCVVLTDHISNLHIDGAIMAYDVLHQMSQEEFDNNLAPDICITVGGKRLMNDPLTFKIRGSKRNIRHWSVREDGKVKDFYMRLSSILEMSQNKFFEFFVEHAHDSKNDYEYLNQWKKYVNEFSSGLWDGFHGVYVQSRIFPSLPENSIVHLAVGQVFHDCRKFVIPESVDVFCNMGTNGIDGCTSTFMGQCAVEKEKMCFLIVGDLSFFYDMNGIWNKDLGKNVRIVLINNNGTDLLRNHNLKAISSVHNTAAKGWVESTGFKYLSAASKEELEEILPWFLSDKSNEPLFLEVFCD